jgi:hypothetical protein
MGKPRVADNALLLTGLLYRDESRYREALRHLIDAFGPLAMASPPLPWLCSEHYSDEMGAPLFRRFVFFSKPVAPDCLAGIKLSTNAIEDALSVDGRRTVNIDPGYLTLAKLVLASTKEYSHRIYIGKGIFAETTLLYEKGLFVPLLRTYNDYKDPKYHELFSLGRVVLRMLPSS